MTTAAQAQSTPGIPYESAISLYYGLAFFLELTLYKKPSMGLLSLHGNSKLARDGMELMRETMRTGRAYAVVMAIIPMFIASFHGGFSTAFPQSFQYGTLHTLCTSLSVGTARKK